MKTHYSKYGRNSFPATKLLAPFYVFFNMQLRFLTATVVPTTPKSLARCTYKSYKPKSYFIEDEKTYE